MWRREIRQKIESDPMMIERRAELRQWRRRRMAVGRFTKWNMSAIHKSITRVEQGKGRNRIEFIRECWRTDTMNIRTARGQDSTSRGKDRSIAETFDHQTVGFGDRARPVHRSPAWSSVTWDFAVHSAPVCLEHLSDVHSTGKRDHVPIDECDTEWTAIRAVIASISMLGVDDFSAGSFRVY